METTKSTTQLVSTEPESDHRGIFQIDAKALREIMPEISIDNTDTQGQLRDEGVFTRLHDRFLLPANYTVRNVFYNHLRGVWDVIVESPDLPDANTFSWNDIEYPHIEAIYCREKDGTVSLMEIRVHSQRVIPVTGGVEVFLRALD